MKLCQSSLDIGTSRWKSLLVCLVVLGLWVSCFYLQRHEIKSNYALDKIVGMHPEDYPQFQYFLNYFGVFPVASRAGELPDGVKAAEQYIAKNGEFLVSDTGTGASRRGDYAKVFLFFPEALLKLGTPVGATTKTASLIVFLLGLGLCFYQLIRARLYLLGAIFVVVMGSNPFQLAQVFHTNNVFSFNISVALVVLGLNLPFFSNQKAWHWNRMWIPLATGAFLSFFWSVRTEQVIIITSVAAIYLLCTQRWFIRGMLIAALLGAFFGGGSFWKQYFSSKRIESQLFIKAHGGVPYVWNERSHHPLWHNFICGLGDFDTKHGFTWDDRSTYLVGLPAVFKKYPFYSYTEGNYFLDQSYDPKGWYPIAPEDFVEYHEALKGHFLGLLQKDPLWYVTILAKRVWRVMSDITLPTVAMGSWQLAIPFHGLLYFVCMGWFVYRKDWFRTKLLLFFIPLSFVALVITSDNGFTYFSVYHLVAFSLLAELLIGRMLSWWGVRCGATDLGANSQVTA